MYRLPLALGDISDDVKRGFLLYEDRHFYHHPGVNPVSLLRALWVDLKARRAVMGGSTLTMQVAKLIEPKPRTLGGKVREVARALQLENVFSKDELLALYLNSVPMGGNVEGVGAASLLYFGKPARDLSFGEAALLVSLPKSPSRNRPDRHPERARRERDKVARRVGPLMGLPPELVDAACRARVPTERRPNPHFVPHLVLRAGPAGMGGRRRYALDPALQLLCEQRLAERVERLKPRGVHNGAVLVVENRTMKVRAYVGSPDFGDALHGGQVNGAAIQRSPGSLLKPFLYAAAADRGRLTGRTTLYDIERNYDGYTPTNFERRYRGPVAAEDALLWSLNAPAVKLEYELGPNGLMGLLRRTPFHGGLRDRRDPGLSVVLGATPLSLEELVGLYAMLANGGRLRAPRFFEGEETREDGLRLLSPEACYLISQILSRQMRPDLPQSWEFTPNRGRIAYKTGTSFGLRDAWCIGCTPEYTVGVWMGNVNAKGSSALIGSAAAAPLVVEIFNDLTRYSDAWFPRPEAVAERKVCAVSGEPAGPDCPAAMTDLYIRGVSDAAPCRLHRRITVRRSDGLEVCRSCMTGPRSAYKEIVVELWPPDVAAFLRGQGKPAGFLPAHNPECPAASKENDLKIDSPRPGGFYAVTGALKEDSQKIPLKVHASRAGERVHWYVDDRFIGSGSPDRTFYVDPVPGAHRAVVIDAQGRSDGVTFRVGRGMP
jgi:penicillin-binding protein 1C